MSDEGTLTPTERQLEAALGALAPARAGIDRDALMFRAGRASSRRGTHAWRATTLVLAAALVVSLLERPGRRVVERIVRVEVEKPAPSPAPTAGPGAQPPTVEVRLDLAQWEARARYVELLNRVARQGPSALPRPRAPVLPQTDALEGLPDIRPRLPRGGLLRVLLPDGDRS